MIRAAFFFFVPLCGTRCQKMSMNGFTWRMSFCQGSFAFSIDRQEFFLSFEPQCFNHRQAAWNKKRHQLFFTRVAGTIYKKV